jgi:hypothetical protein
LTYGSNLEGLPWIWKEGKKVIYQEIYAARAQSSNSTAFESLCYFSQVMLNPLNTKLNPICHLLALLGAHHILHVSRIRVKCFFIPVTI